MLRVSIILSFFSLGIVTEAQTLVGLNPELNWRYMRQAYQTPYMNVMIQPWNIAEIQGNDSLQSGFHYFVHPLADVHFSAGTAFMQQYGAGVHAGLSAGKKLSVDFNYTLNGRQFPAYQQAYIDTTGLIPHYDRHLSFNNDFYLYQSLNFSLSWTPIKYITVRAGKDRHFWGDGYRSLYLSDNANSYPFLQTILKVWHVKYVFMTTRLSDYHTTDYNIP